jgi:microcystin-dependent protein
MAKFSRFTGALKIFAGAAVGLERTIFGSVTQSDNIDTNLNAAQERGWGNVGVNELPTKQDFNALGWTQARLIAYLYQTGVAEWDNAQDYHLHNIVNLNGSLYKCLQNNNTNKNPATETAWWSNISAAAATTAAAVTYSNTTSGLTATNVQAAIDEIIASRSYIVGELRDLAFAAVPSKWLQCNGAAVSRTTYAALFAAIGTTWGAGDGSTTFNLPPARRVLVGSGGTGTATLPNTVGSIGGSETHTLTTGEMPSHPHDVPISGTSGGYTGYALGGTGSALSPLSTTSVGGGGAHNNMQPSMVTNRIIYAGV